VKFPFVNDFEDPDLLKTLDYATEKANIATTSGVGQRGSRAFDPFITLEQRYAPPAKLPGAFPCALCGKVFKWKASMYQHRKLKHKLDDNYKFPRAPRAPRGTWVRKSAPKE